jgi:hypothetical protein
VIGTCTYDHPVKQPFEGKKKKKAFHRSMPLNNKGISELTYWCIHISTTRYQFWNLQQTTGTILYIIQPLKRVPFFNCSCIMDPE